MATKTLMKVLAAFFSSILMSFSIVMIFFAIAIGNVDNNVQHLPQVIETTTQQFLTENKEEVRTYIDQRLKEEGTLPEFTLEELQATCFQDPNSLPGNVCQELGKGITAQEARTLLLDALIDQYQSQFTQEISSNVGTEQIEGAINQLGWLFNTTGILLIIGLLIYLGSVFLTFVGSSFNLLIGSYRVVFKTAFNLLGVGAIFSYFKHMDAGTIIGMAQNIASKLGDSLVLPAEVPDFLLKLIAQIIINWLALSVMPAAKIAWILFVPFAITTAVLIIVRSSRRRKLDLEGKKLAKEEKDFVPKDEIV